jgi:hypothetical protein
MTSPSPAIAALDDTTAIRVLADIADYRAPLPDPAQLRAMETGLRQAITTSPALAVYAQPGAPAAAGDLARATLQHLAATRPDLAPVITRATSHPGHHTRDPAALTVAALAETEVKLTRTTHGRWSFTIHKHPMRDSGLAQVITRLLAYLNGSK